MTTSGYVHTEPFNSGVLPVGDIHRLHFEEYGNKDGKPGKSFELCTHDFLD